MGHLRHRGPYAGPEVRRGPIPYGTRFHGARFGGGTTVRLRGREMMKIVVDSKDQIVEKKADGRGRVTLGSEYAGEEVQLAILKPTDDDTE